MLGIQGTMYNITSAYSLNQVDFARRSESAPGQDILYLFFNVMLHSLDLVKV